MHKMATNSEEKAKDLSKEEKTTAKKSSKESLSHPVVNENNDDHDLDQLLDSALGDFDKPLQPPGRGAAMADVEAATPGPGLNIKASKPDDKQEKKEESRPPPNQDALFEALFNEGPAAQQSAAEFENALSGLMSELGQGLGSDPQFAAEMQKMFQSMASGGVGPAGIPGMFSGGLPGMGPDVGPSAGQGPISEGSRPVGSNPAPANPDDVSGTLADTLNRLAQNAQDLQDGQIPEEEFLRSFGGMNLEEGDTELLPMVQTMMQSLLSKDILYPSLKEVVDKYQGWLDEKKSTLSSSDHQRYSEQHRLMKTLCQEYESEEDTDSASIKQERMGRIMELIQKMERLGQPPSEIVGDMNAGLTFDENGLPRIPGLPQSDQCSLM